MSFQDDAYWHFTIDLEAGGFEICQDIEMRVEPNIYGSGYDYKTFEVYVPNKSKWIPLAKLVLKSRARFGWIEHAAMRKMRNDEEFKMALADRACSDYAEREYEGDFA